MKTEDITGLNRLENDLTQALNNWAIFHRNTGSGWASIARAKGYIDDMMSELRSEVVKSDAAVSYGYTHEAEERAREAVA